MKWFVLGFVLIAVNCEAQTLTNIAGGGGDSMFFKSDGSLWGMGINVYGQLGDGTFSGVNTPEQIIASNVTSVALGYAHSLFLKNDGSLWAVGFGYFGELGDGTYNTNNYPYATNQPEEIVTSGVIAVATGARHSLFLKSNGSLWAMGDNENGQLGDGTFNNTNQPEQIVASGVMAIAAGYGHSLFLKNDGSLWAMGENDYGQLGDVTHAYTNRPEQIVASGVIAIAAGYYHSLFLKNDGSLWAMGDNEYGQLGEGNINKTNRPNQIVASGVTAITTLGNHSLFLKNDGSLWAMGYNFYGQLGDGTFNNVNRPEQIVTNGVTAIAAGGDHSLFLNSNGNLWGMGRNDSGQLGDGTFNNVNVPEMIAPPPIPVISIQPQLLTVTNGNTASFAVTATGSPLLAYQWQFNGTNLNVATNTTLSLQNAFEANAGIYSVIITNFYGSVTSNPAMLTVLPLGIAAPTMLTNGQFQFSFDTANGVNYAVQYSTNLTQWFPFVTLGGIGVPFTLIDPNTAGSQQRFYRIILSPQ